MVDDASRTLQAGFIARHAATATLKSYFYCRPIYPYWTTRRLINGVVSLDNELLGDADLEMVIEGVMQDIQGILTVNDLDYSGWTDISQVPTLIKRATTYGVVASLYARKTKTFQSRVIPSVAPVTVTVLGDQERAMKYWEDKMDKAISLYMSSQEGDIIKVSTIDEEPIFSMEDIPSELTAESSWHKWLKQRAA